MEERTFVPLDERSLKEMQSYGIEEMKRFFQISDGKYKPYCKRLIAACLCQGAAQHMFDPSYGVNDVDIWCFFEEHPDVNIPHRRNMRRSSDGTFMALGTRRVDCMKKMIPSKFIAESASQTIQNYLQNSTTKTAGYLRDKPVVGLFPDSLFGKVIWSAKESQVQIRSE